MYLGKKERNTFLNNPKAKETKTEKIRPYTKIDSKQITWLYVKYKTIKFI